MSKIILCTRKEASHPFIFLNTKVEINTYEELCFYIYNNTVLISKSSLSEKLFDWIRDELDMPELAAKLVALSNKATFAQDLLVEILNAGDYYTPDEIATYVEAWQKYRRLTSSQRKKLKADSYLGYRRYIKAASIYDEILDNQQDITDKVFLGNVYHNRGVAAANNMDVEDAKSYFMKAYELNGNEESLRSYLIVFSAGNDATTLKQEMRKFDLDEDKRMDIILGQLKDEFREQAI